MFQKSTIQLLRFPFSYFLMPIYWFALSFVDNVDLVKSAVIFFILHVLVYPSSNGYNSYMDRDENSIGGIEKPLQPTRQLFIVSIVMDVIAVALSFIISPLFVICICIYILFSRLYSFRGIRLKQYPLIGYLTVVLVQGSLTFFMVYYGAHKQLDLHILWLPMITAAFLIGGFYPITQVYQHDDDKKDGVTTISLWLGKKGTFIFCAGMYSVAMSLLWVYYQSIQLYRPFIILVIFFLPVVVYFCRWFLQVLKDESVVDFKHTMKMNWLASTSTNLAFIIILLFKHFG